jgi:hypothetical protein
VFSFLHLYIFFPVNRNLFIYFWALYKPRFFTKIYSFHCLPFVYLLLKTVKLSVQQSGTHSNRDEMENKFISIIILVDSVQFNID